MHSRNYLITGATGGIGSAIARAAVQAGDRAILLSRSAERLEELVSSLITEDNEAALGIPCDVRSWDDLSDAARRVASDVGGLDVVVVNAGTNVPTSFATRRGAPPDEWASMVDVNVTGAALTARAMLPLLRKGGGHLLFIGSVVGSVVRAGSLYSATKFAVRALAEAVRAEHVSTTVRVTLVQPGLVDTSMVPPARQDDPKLKPEDIAEAVIWTAQLPSHFDVNEITIRPHGQVH